MATIESNLRLEGIMYWELVSFLIFFPRQDFSVYLFFLKKKFFSKLQFF